MTGAGLRLRSEERADYLKTYREPLAFRHPPNSFYRIPGSRLTYRRGVEGITCRSVAKQLEHGMQEEGQVQMECG